MRKETLILNKTTFCEEIMELVNTGSQFDYRDIEHFKDSKDYIDQPVYLQRLTDEYLADSFQCGSIKRN